MERMWFGGYIGESLSRHGVEQRYGRGYQRNAENKVNHDPWQLIEFTEDVTVDSFGVYIAVPAGLYGNSWDDYLYHVDNVEVMQDERGSYAEFDAGEQVPLATDNPIDGVTDYVTMYGLAATLAMQDAANDQNDHAYVATIAEWLGMVGIDSYLGQLENGEASFDVPTLTKIRPHIHYWPNAKDSNTLTDPDLFEAGGIMLDVGKRRGQMRIQFALTMDDGCEPTSIGIDQTDRQIISAVSTLKEAARRETGEPVISAYNICEAMGLMHPEAETQAEVDRRMDRLMSTVAHIDFSEEMKRRKKVNPETGLPFESAIITRHLVEAQRFEGIDTGGNRYVRYRLLADPPTHEHAKAIGQEITWPQRMQELPAIRPDGTAYRRSSTGRQIAIKHEILARTYSLKNRKSNQSDTILYDTLCRSVGIDPKNRKAKKSVVDFAEGFLRSLEAEGVIRDFQPFKEGSSQKKVGVKLFVQQR